MQGSDASAFGLVLLLLPLELAPPFLGLTFLLLLLLLSEPFGLLLALGGFLFGLAPPRSRLPYWLTGAGCYGRGGSGSRRFAASGLCTGQSSSVHTLTVVPTRLP